MPDTHDTLMWEARVAEGKSAAVLDWIERTALPAVRHTDPTVRADVYESTEGRAVVILRFDGPPVHLPEPPAEWIQRAPHQWTFRHVRQP